jgi:hypothetical protein
MVNLWANYGQEIVLLPHFADSQSLNLRTIRTFQTVSLGSSENAGLRRSYSSDVGDAFQ